MTTPRPNRVDLHCHTTWSDGIQSAPALYAEMRQLGMTLVAITDHDTLGAYRELRALGLGGEAGRGGPRLIPGVEINSLAGEALAATGLGRGEGELHILGFGVDPDDAAFEATLARLREWRAARIPEMIERLRANGTPIDGALDDRDAGASFGRPHLARALVRAGYAESVEDAFARFLSRGQPAWVPKRGASPEEAIDAIHGAGGIAVLAHSPDAPDAPDAIEELQGLGLDGLEVHYRTYTPETVARMAAFADERGLLATGGSDYHGDTMSYPEAQASTHVPEAVAERLLAAVDRARAATAR